jgi:hypothetical protein
MNLVGKVAVCQDGHIGVITGHQEIFCAWYWVGYNIENDEPWLSRAPKIIAGSLKEYKEKICHTLSEKIDSS